MNMRKLSTFGLIWIVVVSLVAPDLAISAWNSEYQVASDLVRQGSQTEFTLDLGGVRFDPLYDSMVFPAGWGLTGSSGYDLRLAQLSGPIQESWLAGLRQVGLEIVQYIHPYTYVVWGTEDALGSAGRFSYVRWTGDFSPAVKVLPQWRALDDQPVEVIVMLYRGADRKGILESLELLGGILTGYAESDPVFDLAAVLLPGGRFLDAARLPGVYSIQPKPTDGGLRGEMSNQINAGNYDESNQAFPGYAVWLDSIGVDGAGVIIANVDSGVYENHPDLAGQFLPCEGSSCGGTASSAHGTHTAGIMAATGASGVLDSYGFLRGQGVAPGASMIEQLYTPTYTYPDGMLLLMTQSYRNGALLSGNSWGPSGSPLGYDNKTRQVDVGVRDADPDEPGNQEFSYVLSIMNGNGGTSTQGTPDEAKNIFTIGSTKMQTSGGAQILDIDDLSSNTAHGPALDGRKIPHLVAPGCYVDSSVDYGGGYSTMCGTSMASPHVSGAAALFIEYYRTLFEADPSPAMIKAAFLPVAHDLAGNLDADGGLLGHPFDSKQGWGRMNLPPVLDPDVPVQYFDNPMIFDATGETWTESFAPFDPEKPVRLMLVWTDAPGHGLGGSTPAWNNDLDLVVEYNGQTYYGNDFGDQGWSVPGSSPDDRNNTEGIFLGPVTSGMIEVTVVAANINSDGVPFYGDDTDQDFALVCYNCAQEPGFTLSIDPQYTSVCGEGDVDLTVAVGSIMEYDEPVNLSVQDMPPQTSFDFDINPVIPPGVSLLTLTNIGAETGIYPLILTGDSADKQQMINFNWGIFTEEPAAPVLLFPENYAVNQPTQTTFIWDEAGQASDYRLQIAKDAGFSILVVDIDRISETSYTLSADLDTGTRYYWRVQAGNACGLGSFSSVFTFTTEPLPGDCGPDSTAIVFHESDFESGADGWTVTGGVQNQWALSNEKPHSGEYSFFAPNLGSVSDQRLISPEIMLPGMDQAPITFTFWNWHSFENDFSCWDGGLLEVSLDSGSVWVQVPTSAMLTQPYDGTVSSNYQNPIGGMQAWCHNRDWNRSVVDLSVYAEEMYSSRAS